jgi:hypothetical protein
MSWISMLAAWQWALLSLVPIGIILLYFLKLRREPVEVPSTYLWSRTIEDLHVNSLLQRLRRSLLLLLQLLVVIFAALALLRPGIRGENLDQRRIVFLLDTSASMQATDVEGGESRFETARRMIRERIDAVSAGESLMLVTFSDRPEVLQSFTTDRGRIREALRRAQVTNHSTDILGALKAADGLANPPRSSEVGDPNDVQVADAKPADLLLYSDGGFESVTEFDLGNLIPQYIAIGSKTINNLAITAFSAERNVEKPTEVQAFATVVNLGNESASATATLSWDDQALTPSEAFRDAESVSLELGEQVGLSFTLDSEEAVSLRLALDIDDDLQLDNFAFAGLTPMRTVSVLVVTPGNKPLELGLKTQKAAKICIPQLVLPSYLETDEYKSRAQSGIDDLIIYDRCSPTAMPLTNTFFIGTLPPADDLALSHVAEETETAQPPISETEIEGAGGPSAAHGWSWATEPSSVVLIDIDRTHPIMRFMEVFSLLIFDGRAVSGPPGSTELIGADVGPMLVVAPRGGYQDMVLGFEIISSDGGGAAQTNTNWYAERSWPVFILNVLRYLAGAAESSGAPSYQPGQTVQLRLESAITEATFRRIGGDAKSVAPGPSGIAEILDTESPGNYRVEADDQLADLFSVNLFQRTESDLAVAPSVELGYESVEAATGGIEVRVEYWRYVLLLMLMMLVAEWWLYSRRVA